MGSKILLILVFLCFVFSKPVLAATIVLEPNTKYQTIVGWEAVSQAGQWDFPTQFNTYKNTLFDQAVNDLGINRLRVEIFAKNMNGIIVFDLASLDKEFDAVVIPMKQRLEARGEKLFISVCFVGSNNNSTYNTNPSDYAQQVLLTYQHLQSKYGFIPDGWEVILEPGWVASPKWSGEQIGEAMIATGDLLKANNFPTYFIAPSGEAGPDVSLGYFNSMITWAPGSAEYIKEFSYHRYSGASLSTMATVASLRTSYNINTAMLEHGGADYNELHDDLKYANVSAWEQYTLAYPTSDDGYQYYPISGSTIIMGSRTKFLRQYFKYIRRDAVRIGASTGNTNHDPVAFINKDGKYVVVVKSNGGSFSVGNLPAGTYGIFYTTDSEYNKNLPDQVISAGQDLNTSIPATGVITIYAKTVVTPVAGDQNGDGKVNILDLRLAIKNFSSIFELATVIANYGK